MNMVCVEALRLEPDRPGSTEMYRMTGCPKERVLRIRAGQFLRMPLYRVPHRLAKLLGTARGIVDADGGRDDAENSYYGAAADPQFIALERSQRRFRGAYLRRLRRRAARREHER